MSSYWIFCCFVPSVSAVVPASFEVRGMRYSQLGVEPPLPPIHRTVPTYLRYCACCLAVTASGDVGTEILVGSHNSQKQKPTSGL